MKPKRDYPMQEFKLEPSILKTRELYNKPSGCKKNDLVISGKIFFALNQQYNEKQTIHLFYTITIVILHNSKSTKLGMPS